MERDKLDGPWQGACQLRLSGEREPGQPGEVIAYLSYKAQISLRPGTYQLHVVHATIGLTPPPREILHTTITVP